MTQKNTIKLFEEKLVRTVWDDDQEKWYFSIIDVVSVLTDSANPRRYWSDLKRKLTIEGSQLYESIVQLKLKTSDGKSYKTDVADTEQLFRLIQSIPSPKAEPFKMWLAHVAAERLDEIQDPELTDSICKLKSSVNGIVTGYRPACVTQSDRYASLQIIEN